MKPDSLKVRIVFSFVMASLMVTLITFVLGPLRQGFASGWLALWAGMWITAFPVAVVAVGLVAPLARKITLRLLGMHASG